MCKPFTNLFNLHNQPSCNNRNCTQSCAFTCILDYFAWSDPPAWLASYAPSAKLAVLQLCSPSNLARHLMLQLSWTPENFATSSKYLAVTHGAGNMWDLHWGFCLACDFGICAVISWFILTFMKRIELENDWCWGALLKRSRI